MSDSPATPECPDVSTCVHCKRRIYWNDYGYVHREGWADCFLMVMGVLTNMGTTARPVEMVDA